MDIATIYVTSASREEAEQIARTLLQERLIACANIVPGATSIYRWEGKVETAEEVILLLKTQTSLIKEVTTRVRELHSYDCPCISAWSSIGGNEEYFRWVAAETQRQPPA